MHIQKKRKKKKTKCEKGEQGVEKRRNSIEQNENRVQVVMTCKYLF